MDILIDRPAIEVKTYSKKKLCRLMGFPNRKQFDNALKALDRDKYINFKINKGGWYLFPSQVRVILEELYY